MLFISHSRRESYISPEWEEIGKLVVVSPVLPLHSPYHPEAAQTSHWFN